MASLSQLSPHQNLLAVRGQGSSIGSARQQTFVSQDAAISAAGESPRNDIIAASRARPLHLAAWNPRTSGLNQPRTRRTTALKTQGTPSVRAVLSRSGALQHVRPISLEPGGHSDSKALVGKLRAAGIQLFRFAYASGREHIDAVIALPPHFSAKKKYPVVVFNRGGSSDFGGLNFYHMRFLQQLFSSKGYVVVAGEHRGVGINNGADQFGGSDDIAATLALVNIAGSLPFTRGNDVYMAGHSRGGMTTYQALRAGAKVKAAVVIAGLTDLDAWQSQRQQSHGENLGKAIYGRHIPGYTRATRAARDKLLRQRSAVSWANEIDTPVLIMHGDADRRVALSQAARLADGLKKAGKAYAFESVPGGDHSLDGHQPYVSQRVDRWFKARR